MIFVIVGAVICAVIGFKITRDNYFAAISSMCGLIAGILLWLSIGGLIAPALPTTEIVKEQEIVALNNSENYLSPGYTDGSLVYRYAVNTENGKHVEEIKRDNIYINEGDYKPMIKTHTFCLKDKWCHLIAHDLFLNNKDYVEVFIPQNNECEVNCK